MTFGYRYDGSSARSMVVMMFLMIAGTVGVVLLIVWLIRGAAASPESRPDTAGSDEAIAIVRRRQAAGESNREPYDEIMRSLGR